MKLWPHKVGRSETGEFARGMEMMSVAITKGKGAKAMSTEAPNVFALEQSEGSSLTADFSWTFVGNAIYARASSQF